MRAKSTLLPLLLLLGCAEKAADDTGGPPDPNLIGAKGGTVTVAGGPTLEIPEGALQQEVRIVIRKATLPPGTALVAVSDVWSFGPSGLMFEKPVRVTIPFTDPDEATLSFYWSRENDTGFDPFPGASISGGVATASVDHFSLGFVGRPGQEEMEDAGVTEADAGEQEEPDAGTPDADAGQMSGGDAGSMMCVDTTVYADTDADGFGVDNDTQTVCLDPNEEEPGYARESGDCQPVDTWANPDATEICGDNYDDDCDNVDADCPTTQAASLDLPSWDCTGTPPENVYAYGVFASGGGYYQDNGCFVIFEGLRDEFYVQHNLSRVSQDASCTTVAGCVCPSLNGWPSYDRRLYAFTWNGDTDQACELAIQDNGNIDQTVSTGCRKYLYQMHWPGQEISEPYVAGTTAELDRRLALFPKLEVACAHDAPHQNLPFQQLLVTDWVKNAGFVKK